MDRMQRAVANTDGQRQTERQRHTQTHTETQNPLTKLQGVAQSAPCSVCQATLLVAVTQTLASDLYARR